jgi:diguanylate cyclase (GGDEF)-like protein
MDTVSTLQEKETQAAEGRARKLFWGSLLLNVLIVVHLVYQTRQLGGFLAVTQTVLPAVLLWSLAMTAYAFITLNTIAKHRAQRLASAFTDLTTGLFNLEYLKSCLVQEQKRSVEDGTSAAVVYADLVNLDKVNQNYGHAVGDIVLKAIAKVIADNVRRGDIVGRVGGDEFLVIMPETTMGEAEGLVRSIRSAVRDYRLELGKRGTIDFLSCTIGVAIFPTEGETPEEILSVARKKLVGTASAGRKADSKA